MGILELENEPPSPDRPSEPARDLGATGLEPPIDWEPGSWELDWDRRWSDRTVCGHCACGVGVGGEVTFVGVGGCAGPWGLNASSV